MSIKQLPPTAPRYTDQDRGHDQEEWTAVRTLIEQVNQSGLVSQPPQARISTRNPGNVQSATANVWTALNLIAEGIHYTPINFTLSTSTYVTYTGATSTNIDMFATVYVRDIGATRKEVGLAKNGTTPFWFNTVSNSRTEFSTAIKTSIDVAPNDQLSVVYRSLVGNDTDFTAYVLMDIVSTGIAAGA